MSELIKINGLSVDLMSVSGLIHAVRDINLSIGTDEIHGIVGESGCGKSMTAKSILRLHDESKVEYGGEIMFDGSDILKMKNKELLKMRGKDISMIFQDPMTTFNPLMKIGDQISETILLHEKVTKQEAKKRTIAALEKVGILPGAARYGMYPFEMSGGQLQRASIAMSLVCSPRLLIADEPTTALDVTMQAQILKLMKQLQGEMHSSVLIITHNFGVIAEICDKVSVMYAGQIIESGDVRRIFYDPCHPYTKDLIDSIPRSGERATKLISIPGSPPKLNQEITGCAYAPRCKYATERCRREAPEFRTLEGGHRYLCHLEPGALAKGGETA
ncbi:MAG: ABC transporter ATP-binding protein [Oscillospiraceae bacterium]|nr:ABC transporter ATP-binding protein [Oscillospiraceae bacterium]